MTPKRLVVAALVLVSALFALRRLTSAQQPTPSASSTKHVPIALPMQAPSGWDPLTYAHFRQRCQEVADKSAANLPMDSGDYAYAEACTERGAFFHPVKLLPKPSPMALAPTPIATPGPNGHVPMPWDLPKDPPKGTPFEKDPQYWANLRTMCQAIADKAYAHQPTDLEAFKECGRAVTVIRQFSKPMVSLPAASPEKGPLPTLIIPE